MGFVDSKALFKGMEIPLGKLHLCRLILAPS